MATIVNLGCGNKFNNNPTRRQSRYRCTNTVSIVKYETFTGRYIAVHRVIRRIYDSLLMTNDNGIFLWEGRIHIHPFIHRLRESLF